jgi:hypothetical protein
MSTTKPFKTLEAFKDVDQTRLILDKLQEVLSIVHLDHKSKIHEIINAYKSDVAEWEKLNQSSVSATKAQYGSVRAAIKVGIKSALKINWDDEGLDQTYDSDGYIDIDTPCPLYDEYDESYCALSDEIENAVAKLTTDDFDQYYINRHLLLHKHYQGSRLYTVGLDMLRDYYISTFKKKNPKLILKIKQWNQ